MKILVADDRAENRYLLEQLLRAKGHEVFSAVDGIDAMERLTAIECDLVISDIMMPRMDGFELCYNVKLNPALARIPFIFYTATYTSDDDKAFGLSLGADAFILKPAEPQAILNHIDLVLAKAGHFALSRMHRRLTHDHVGFLKGYNERLVRKLQEKAEEARDANRQLNELNANLEQRVTEKTLQLARSNRELQTFAYTLSHDLRSPLRTIAGYTEALRDTAAQKLSAEERLFCEKVISAAARMEQMIQDVLDYSTAGAAVACERVDADAVVRDVARSSPSFERRVEIVNVLPPIVAHAASLRQALLNLFSNAVKFVRPGIPPQIRVRSEIHGPEVRLWIEDNGIGIAPEQQTKLFALFERLHPGYEGSGIGLAIVARAAERMHGKFGVESELGKGSRFWLQLPRAPDESSSLPPGR